MALLFSASSFANTATDFSRYQARIASTAMYQNKKQSAIDIDGLLPLWQTPLDLVFLELRGFNRQGPSLEVNLGLGYRYLSPNHEALYGVSAWWDVRRSQSENVFHQFTLGAEYKTPYWQYNGNIYLPYGKRGFNNTASGTLLPGNNPHGFKNVIIHSGVERALPGLDAEIGHRFEALPAATLFGGIYYFPGKNKQTPTVAGPSLRLQYRLNEKHGATPQSTIEFGLKHDKVRGTQFLMGLTLQWGGHQDDADYLEREMTARIRRDLDVVTSTKKQSAPMMNQAQRPSTVATVHDLNEMQHAIDHAADVILVDGAISNVPTLNLKDNQTLTGGRISLSDYSVLQLANNHGSLTGGNNDLIYTASNNKIYDLSLSTAAGYNAITNPNGAGVGNLEIANIQSDAPFFFNFYQPHDYSYLNIHNNILNLHDVPSLAIHDNTPLLSNLPLNVQRGMQAGIGVVAQDNAHVEVEAISHNQISLGSSGAACGVCIFAMPRINSVSTPINNHIHVHSIDHNVIQRNGSANTEETVGVAGRIYLMPADMKNQTAIHVPNMSEIIENAYQHLAIDQITANEINFTNMRKPSEGIQILFDHRESHNGFGFKNSQMNLDVGEISGNVISINQIMGHPRQVGFISLTGIRAGNMIGSAYYGDRHVNNTSTMTIHKINNNQINLIGDSTIGIALSNSSYSFLPPPGVSDFSRRNQAFFHNDEITNNHLISHTLTDLNYSKAFFFSNFSWHDNGASMWLGDVNGVRDNHMEGSPKDFAITSYADSDLVLSEPVSTLPTVLHINVHNILGAKPDLAAANGSHLPVDISNPKSNTLQIENR
jgi:hypothetical protein